VLSASADPVLRYSRELLLSSEGCEVKTSLSKAHAHELIKSQSFDVLVFGNSLSARSCRELEESFRLRNPQGKIVEILLANWDVPMNNPDAVADSPEELLSFIRELAGEEKSQSTRDAPRSQG
jgi:CheY-like chemotaxis protein